MKQRDGHSAPSTNVAGGARSDTPLKHTPMPQLVRQAIFHELDTHEWNFSLDEDRVDFADRVAAWVPTVETKINVELLEALEAAIRVIKAWHNMGGCPDHIWKIYYYNAPEMKPIRAAISRATGKG